MEIHQLCDWLYANNFRTVPSVLVNQGDCRWYAYRRSKLGARRCECNEDKVGMQIILTPYIFHGRGMTHSSVEVALSGEFDGMWWKLQSYGHRFADIPADLDGIETKLIRAWNNLYDPTEKS